VIPAGRSGKLVAKVHTKSTQNATLRKSISVFTDDKTVKSLKLSMEFTVESMLTIRPRAQLYINGVVGKALETRVLLHRNDGKKLKIKEIRFADPSVKLRTEAYDSKEKVPPGFKPVAGDVWLIAEVSEDARPGPRNTKAWLKTNHPEMGDLELPVNIRIRPLIEPSPGEVRLMIQKDGRGSRGTMFRLTNNGGEKFTIESIEVADPTLFKASVMDPEPTLVHRIQVELLNDVDFAAIKGSRQSKILMHTSVKAQPLVEVPVRLTAREVVKRSKALPGGKKMKSKLNPRPLPTGTPNPGGS